MNGLNFHLVGNRARFVSWEPSCAVGRLHLQYVGSDEQILQGHQSDFYY